VGNTTIIFFIFLRRWYCVYSLSLPKKLKKALYQTVRV